MAALLARLPLSHHADALLDSPPLSDYDSIANDVFDQRSSPLTSPRFYGKPSRAAPFDRQRILGPPPPSPIAIPGQRSLYRSMSADVSARIAPSTDAMADSVAADETGSTTAPDSPPDLCDGKSSKSSRSSLRSESDLSDGTPSTDKLGRYEQLGLDDTNRDSLDDSNLKPESRPTLRRATPRTVSALNEVGEAYTKLRTISTNGVLRDQSLNLPGGRMLRRGFTAPAVQVPGRSPHADSRSPSPSNIIAQRKGSATSITRSVSNTSLSSEDTPPHLVAAFHRPQWHTRRKSVKELEAECNDDDDDGDVPPDAVLGNVPISPMPGLPRTPRLSSRSNTPSPHRRSSWQAHANLHSANVPKNAKRPSAPSVLPGGRRGSPRSPRHPRPHMLQHSVTAPIISAGSFARKPRPKSWTEDLNEEALQLSAALVEYSDKLTGVSSDIQTPRSGFHSASSSPPRPTFVKPRSMTNILELTQSQKGGVMIDPLPISKEKEAVLTRTRPSWLPPKSQKEERRHLREWEQMMGRVAENEKKRALKEREQRESREEMSDSMARIWDQHVLPNWDEVIKEPRTRELWWRGVTPRSRGVVWKKAIGNDLELSEASYQAALNRANALEDKLAAMPTSERSASREAAWFDAINRDVPTVVHKTTADNLSETNDRSRPAFHAALTDVLRAYAIYRSDVGYVYGTHDIAGLLCLHMSPADAFVALANVFNRPMPLAFLVHDSAGMSRAHNLVLTTLKYKLPRLHGHLTSPALDLSPAEYLDPLFRRLFTGPPVQSDLAARIWDVFVFEGDKALVRSAVAVLSRLEPRLYAGKDEILDLLGWHNVETNLLGEEEEFVSAVREAGKVEGSKGGVSSTSVEIVVV